jgi:hypothetical protein
MLNRYMFTPAIWIAVLVLWALPTFAQRPDERRKQMLRKLMIVILVGVIFGGLFSSNIVAENFERLTPTNISSDQIVPFSPTLLTGEKDFCLIQSDDDNVMYYFADFQAGDGFALYMDPAQCGVPDPYPFKITDVHFYLYDPGGYTWPVEIQVSIRDLNGADKCNGPGNLLCSQIYTIPSDSAYPNLIHLDLDLLCCVYNPFFLEIIYTGGTSSPYPSLLMTDTINATDTCDAWVWYFWEGEYSYFEWHYFWGPPPPGYPVMRITGYTQAGECDSNDPPDPFSLLFPPNKAFTPRVVRFDWETATDPNPFDQVTYDLYVSTSYHSFFDSATIDSNLVTSECFKTLDYGTYYWKVKAKDNRGAETWSDQTRYFMVTGIHASGDFNGDGSIDVADVVFSINYLYNSGPAPDPLWVADCDCDGKVDIADAVYLINYLFLGGPPPCEP